MTTQAAIALYILAVTAWIVFCAALHNIASKRKREARRVNLTRLRQQFDRQPSDEPGERFMYVKRKTKTDERGRLRGKVN